MGPGAHKNFFASALPSSPPGWSEAAAPHKSGAGELANFRIAPRPQPGGGKGADGKQFVARPAEIELHLAVLVDRPERRHRRGAPAVLAAALGPQLHVPTRAA